VLSVGGSIEAQRMLPPPHDVSGTLFKGPGLCEFPVQIDLSGKGSQIDLPGGGFILTSPGLFATLTNLDSPEHQVTLNITGTITFTNDGLQAVMNGRNIFFDPSVGFVLLIGNFTAITSGGVTTLSGNGQVIDLCDLVS
jgi:hypothetical protein